VLARKTFRLPGWDQRFSGGGAANRVSRRASTIGLQSEILATPGGACRNAASAKGVGSVSGIVVGVDGSPGARGALAWAATEARLRQAVLQVVYAYQIHGSAFHDYDPIEHSVPGAASPDLQPSEQDEPATMPGRARVAEAFQNEADDLLDSLLGEFEEALTGIDVQRSVINDRHPGKALLEASRGADLLVVGSRGHGGFTELMLGSVSHSVVLHAVCPVVVVPLRNT
jgi:nucleotide-binding universal stress UspA family protein